MKKKKEVLQEDRDFKEFLKSITRMVSKCESLMLACHKSMEEQSSFVAENYRTNQNVDETLGNILLAIRQNEYLKAWYPAQHGFPEMKVCGKHPCKQYLKGNSCKNE